MNYNNSMKHLGIYKKNIFHCRRDFFSYVFFLLEISINVCFNETFTFRKENLKKKSSPQRNKFTFFYREVFHTFVLNHKIQHQQ